MAAFYPEKIIPLIHVSRKLMACDSRQQMAVLQQLPQIFESHQLVSVLRGIIFSGICNRNFYDKIPAALYHEIASLLPEDNQLDLKDSLYESGLTEIPDDTEDDEESANQKKKRLPLTLLRIPSDLQCLLLQFLNFHDLMSVQRVCRSLCITARNPCSLYSLGIDPELSSNHHFVNECYSRPKMLTIFHTHLFRRINEVPAYLNGNAKWSENVTNLCIDLVHSKFDMRNLGIFVNLEKCQIKWTRSILVNGQIRSYHTLKVLHIEGIAFTEDVIDEICKFKNLEVLTLEGGVYCDSNPSGNSAHVTLPRLREFSYSSPTTPRLFQRILIGSHPEIVNLEDDVEIKDIPQTHAAVQAIRAIKYLNLNLWNSPDLMHSLSPLLRKAQRLGTQLFEECKLFVKIESDVDDYDMSSALQPIATLMECGKNATFHLICEPMESSNVMNYDIVDFIRSSTSHTFNQITLDLSCILYLEYAWNELVDIDIGERDYEVVMDVVMKDIDEAEKWMKSWLVFDEQNMKQIGLQKLDIKFKYEVPVYFDDLPDLVGNWDDADEVLRMTYCCAYVSDCTVFYN